MEAGAAAEELEKTSVINDDQSPQSNVVVQKTHGNGNSTAVDSPIENGVAVIEGGEAENSNDDNETQWNCSQSSGNKNFNSPALSRGRGGGVNFQQFGRGTGGRGGGGNTISRPAYDQNWPQNNRSGNTPVANGAPLELWVEAKTEDGKSYFYHALSRETTWTKPEGPLVKVMTQVEIEEVNRKKRVAENRPAVDVKEDADTSLRSNEPHTPNMSQPPPNATHPPSLNKPPPSTNVAAPPPIMQRHQPPPYFQPPNFAQPPFGMPPPGYGGYAAPPWATAGGGWNQPPHMHMPLEKPAKNLIIKPGIIDPNVIARAAEWTEHRAPDGRPYYYHAARGESVWEKPQALRDMEAARMAAHSGATPQQAVGSNNALPHVMSAMAPNLMPPNTLIHMPPGVAVNYDANSLAYNATLVKVNDPTKLVAEKEAKKLAEEKRKKEVVEQQKKENNVNKVVDKSRPISSTPIAGTPWCVVWTGDGRVFFYNPSTRTSVWERPEELLERTDVDKAVSTPPEQLRSSETVGQHSSSQQKTVIEQVEAAKKTLANVPVKEEEDESKTVSAGDDEVIKIRTESESSVEEVPTKKSKLSKVNKKADANEAVVEAEIRAAKERALVPLETRIKQFKEMLREKDVSAFSTWEKELHKIVFDPRYLLLTSKERKQVFEKYVKDRAEEERKEKRNKMRQKRDDFRQLMEDAKMHGKSSFSDFCQRFGKDERYKAIEKVRERESLFNEYIVDIRRREKEEKQQKKEQIRKDFLEMLRERNDLDRHSRWHDVKKKFESDARYRAVEGSAYREQYFGDYMRQLKDEKRRQRDQKDRDREKERERERKSDRKDKDRKEKDRGRERSRSRGKDRDGDKEGSKENELKKANDSTEDEHCANDDEQQRATNDDEVERVQKERDRQLRAEQSIREREKEVQRTLAGHLRERDKEREHHKRDEAIGHFNALLIDLVRNPDLTWKEVKRQLRKDHRWDMIETLDRDDREKIFNAHIDGLMKKKREKFREMLDELPQLALTSSWKDIKKTVKDDPRYLKYNSSEKCEREFRDYIKDKTAHAKAALRALLQECKLITHKSNELVSENPNHLKEIQDILKNDKRYLVLEHMAEDRTAIVLSYLEELQKRGPPPPPTASESIRRNK